MKTILFILSFSFFLPLASQAQAVRGGGGGDRPGNKFLRYQGCEEGRVALFTESTLNDRSIMVRRVCRNGSYYPRTPAPTVRYCKEGAIIRIPQDHNGEDLKVCRNGRYVDAF